MDYLRPVLTRLEPAMPIAKLIGPSVGLITAAAVFRVVIADNIYWLLSYPAHGVATAANWCGRGRLTVQLLHGVKDIWSSGATAFNNRFGTHPISTLKGEALQAERTRVKDLAQRMQDCAIVIGILSLYWGACGLLGFEEAGGFTPLLPLSVTTLCLSGVAIASLNFCGAWLLGVSARGVLVMPPREAGDTLVELVPKVLEAARANQHIGTATPTREVLKRATVAYLLCSVGPVEAKNLLGALNVHSSYFSNAQKDIPEAIADRNRVLGNLIRSDTTVYTDWNNLMHQLGANQLLDECIGEALR